MSGKTKSKPSTKLSVEAYEFVLDKLVTWNYQPGDILVETDIAGQIGTSRTPVREALRALVAEGFLKVVPRTGYMVLPLTPDDVREIYQMRLLLEGEAAALAAKRVNDAEVQKIIQRWKSRLQGMDHANTELGKSRPPTPDDNTPFHLAIARASGNSRLVEAVEKVLEDTLRVMSYYQTKVDRSTLAEYHLHILDAICTGDPEHARGAMRQHIQEGGSAIERWFASFSRQPP